MPAFNFFGTTRAMVGVSSSIVLIVKSGSFIEPIQHTSVLQNKLILAEVDVRGVGVGWPIKLKFMTHKHRRAIKSVPSLFLLQLKKLLREQNSTAIARL